MISNTRFVQLILGGWLCLVAIGCGGKSIESYKPKSDTARQAVTKALDAWKSGQALATIPGPPAIDTFDARWRSGAKLEQYSIEEEIKGQEHPQFKVRMKLAGKAEEAVEYIVVGIDPLLVFRKEDYQKATGQ
jgi:hypothetical protein